MSQKDGCVYAENNVIVNDVVRVVSVVEVIQLLMLTNEDHVTYNLKDGSEIFEMVGLVMDGQLSLKCDEVKNVASDVSVVFYEYVAILVDTDSNCYRLDVRKSVSWYSVYRVKLISR